MDANACAKVEKAEKCKEVAVEARWGEVALGAVKGVAS